MAEHFNQAWLLLGVGMLTVFSVLWMVVLIGNGIIWFVDRFLPEPKAKTNEKPGKKGEVNSDKIAAIVTAVKMVTGGRGRVTNIERKQ